LSLALCTRLVLIKGVCEEFLVALGVLSTGMGSFDCIRLAPPFAQDDSGLEVSVLRGRLPSQATLLRAEKISRAALLTAVLCIVLTLPAAGQWMGKQTGCYADAIAANPNRPTVADPADITQFGVLELEYGFDEVWPHEGARQKSVGGLLKFGMLCDVELRWSTTSFISQIDAGATHQGFGDNWLGPQVRFYRQTRHVPSLAFGYAVKIPSASTTDGLGSGRVDHAFTLFASKDVAHIHFDFNASEFLVGRTTGAGIDSGQELNLAFSRAIRGRLQFTGEFYGDTRLNSSTPGFVSSLWALTYSITPRLVIDGGFEIGLTDGGPHRHAFVGATYAIANLYPGRRKR
jgi:hypothetical protein